MIHALFVVPRIDFRLDALAGQTASPFAAKMARVLSRAGLNPNTQDPRVRVFTCGFQDAGLGTVGSLLLTNKLVKADTAK